MKTVVVLASAFMIAFSAGVRADDLKVLEERFAEVTDAAVPAAAAGRIRDAQRPDGSWDGVDYADKSLGIWQPSVGHLRKRVLVLARAYRATQDRTRVLCAYIDHGVAPKDASYRYRIVKKQTKENIK